jgi:putative protease
MEILAPAGGQEQLLAAVRTGADAVYLGTGSFNARRNAKNFGADELKQAVSYCHGRGVKVHVTVNTLVKDRELETLYNEIRLIGESGADAVIIQDMAVMAMFKKHLPDMPLHASTQLTVHNAEGALAARELGFSRVVLARELTLNEIRLIAEKAGIELECFVQGALCMSVSGQCELSSMFGGRSGNRGMCAQPCRLDFKAGNRSYALSLKDMSYISHIKELEAAGVASLKIEGRMKRPEYVAAATDACVKALRGEAPDIKRLERIFSRSGFTDGYLTGKRNLSMFGHRTEDDVIGSSEEISKVRELYRRELSHVPVNMVLTVKRGERSRLTACDGINSVTVYGDIPENTEKAFSKAENSLGRTGGTPFVLNKAVVDIEDGYSVKVNSLRKEALEKLLAIRSEVKPLNFTGKFSPPLGAVRETSPSIRLRFEKKEQIFTSGGLEYIYLPAEEADEEIINSLGERLIAELPRLVYPADEERLEKKLIKLKAEGLSNICAGNLGTIRLAKRLGFKVYGAFDNNILNTRALEVYEKIGLEDVILSYEISMKDAVRLGGSIKRGIIGYGYLPLMLFRNCPVKTEKGCGECYGRKKISDRQGIDFSVLCHYKGYSSLLNSVPLYIGDKQVKGIDFTALYFTTENSNECKRIYQLYKNREEYKGRRTQGLYLRTLK